MNFYESLFIINPALDDMEVKKVVDKVEGLIKKEGGEILKVDNWGKKKLAYEVKRQKKGYYILINIRVKASTISELERSLKLTDPVIKFLIIRLDKEPVLNNPVMLEVQEHAGEEQRIAEGHRSMTDREGK